MHNYLYISNKTIFRKLCFPSSTCIYRHNLEITSTRNMKAGIKNIMVEHQSLNIKNSVEMLDGGEQQINL